MTPVFPEPKIETFISTIPAIGEEDRLWRELHVLEESAQDRFGSALMLKVEMGNRLIRLKEITPHGKFMARAGREFPKWTARHIQRHMKLAANATRVSHLDPEASLRMALAVIAASSESAETRDLAQAIAYDVIVPTPNGEERAPCSRNFAELFMRWTGVEPIQIVERA